MRPRNRWYGTSNSRANAERLGLFLALADAQASETRYSISSLDLDILDGIELKNCMEFCEKVGICRKAGSTYTATQVLRETLVVARNWLSRDHTLHIRVLGFRGPSAAGSPGFTWAWSTDEFTQSNPLQRTSLASQASPWKLSAVGQIHNCRAIDGIGWLHTAMLARIPVSELWVRGLLIRFTARFAEIPTMTHDTMKPRTLNWSVLALGILRY